MQEGRILTLPMLLQSHSPNLDRLPLFLVRLATEVSSENSSPSNSTCKHNNYCHVCTHVFPFRWSGRQRKSVSRHLLKSVATSTALNMTPSYWTALKREKPPPWLAAPLPSLKAKAHRHQHQQLPPAPPLALVP